jgi:uncharacterized protein
VSGVQPEERVSTPMLVQRWLDVLFLHWPVDPSRVAASLPEGLTVDTCDGAAWVTLTPFKVEGMRPAFLPPVPVLSNFIETNVRTYVVGPDGRDGLWFFTLETDSLSTTIAARTFLGVPYRWATMDRCRRADLVTYSSRRRLGDPWPRHRTSVATGQFTGVADARLAGWLTGRWRAWTRVAGRLLTVPVEHEPWPLTDATIDEHDDTLLASLGLPEPTTEPVVHAAAGVTARLGWPQRPYTERARSPKRARMSPPSPTS